MKDHLLPGRLAELKALIDELDRWKPREVTSITAYLRQRYLIVQHEPSDHTFRECPSSERAYCAVPGEPHSKVCHDGSEWVDGAYRGGCGKIHPPSSACEPVDHAFVPIHLRKGWAHRASDNLCQHISGGMRCGLQKSRHGAEPSDREPGGEK